MKWLIVSLFFISSLQSIAQYNIKNYTNADLQQQQIMKELVDYIQFGQPDRVLPYIKNPEVIDKSYFNIESVYLSKTYGRKSIASQSTKIVEDESTLVWYERNIFKIKKNGEKAVYQIYVTVAMDTSPNEILDLFLRKGKRIKHAAYQEN